MIGYVTLGAADIGRAKDFYAALLADLGASVVMDTDRVAAFSTGSDDPLLAVIKPHNGEAPSAGNGTMVALPVGSNAVVDTLHARALQLGGADEGAPGERSEGFYAAYCRDLDGNKLCLYHRG
ncbi:MAG: VOC family protein [Halioglobus sp.]|nr:VOC family protein [Halioglobus sp.]